MDLIFTFLLGHMQVVNRRGDVVLPPFVTVVYRTRSLVERRPKPRGPSGEGSHVRFDPLGTRSVAQERGGGINMGEELRR
jgi:hypothetical protein